MQETEGGALAAALARYLNLRERAWKAAERARKEELRPFSSLLLEAELREARAAARDLLFSEWETGAISLSYDKEGKL